MEHILVVLLSIVAFIKTLSQFQSLFIILNSSV